MRRNLKWFVCLMVVVGILASPLFLATPSSADKLSEAIEQGITDGKIDKKAEPGFLGIPGAPKVSYILGFLWAIWVGWIFSTVGAFGGIMAGVGHITIFGLGDYAKDFGKGYPMNKLVTDSIRVSNQWLVGLSGLISSTNYYRMGRLVAPLGMCLAIGGVGRFLAHPRSHSREDQPQGLYRLLRHRSTGSRYYPVSGDHKGRAGQEEEGERGCGRL